MPRRSEPPSAAVAVWRNPSASGFDIGGGAWDREGTCRKRSSRVRLLSEWATHHPGLEIDLDVVCGGAAQVLVDGSENVVLLVVGTRGHGGFADLMLGSTSIHLRACCGLPRPGVPMKLRLSLPKAVPQQR